MASPPSTGPLHAPAELPPPGSQTEGREDARYQPLFALSPLPAGVYDSDTLCFLEVNEAAVRSYGWTREEFLGMTLRDIRPPAEQSRLDRLLEATPGNERQANASLHRTKSGQLRRVEVSSYPVEFDERPARMVLVHDVTDRFEARDALVRSEQKYRSVIEQLQDVFFRTDEQGTWTFLTPAWINLSARTSSPTSTRPTAPRCSTPFVRWPKAAWSTPSSRCATSGATAATAGSRRARAPCTRSADVSAAPPARCAPAPSGAPPRRSAFAWRRTSASC